MPVLRELIAKLGFQVDASGFAKADAATTKVKAQAEAMTAAVKAASVAMRATAVAAGSAAGGVAAFAAGLAAARAGLLGAGSAASSGSAGLVQVGSSAQAAANQVGVLVARLQQARGLMPGAGGGAIGPGAGSAGLARTAVATGHPDVLPALPGGAPRMLGAGGASGAMVLRSSSALAGVGGPGGGGPAVLIGRLVPPAEAAAEAVDKLKRKTVDLLGPFGRFLTLSAAAFGMKKVLDLASDAHETQNVLQEVFGAQGQAQINAWAKVQAEAMGRSRYALRDYAGQLGAMLEPMVKSPAVAQQMSTGLAALAVDLGSFFNATDPEALIALKAGIAGETEPLRRFGIVMLDATLQEYALTQGIHKKIEKMTVAEKTQLRYNFILENSKKAQGDAARTIDGYANKTKVAEARIRSLGTAIGEKLMPAGRAFMDWAGKAAGAFQDLTEGNNSFEIGLMALAGWLVAFKAEAITEWLVAFAPIAGVLLALAAMVFLIDDINTAMDGGESAFDSWSDKMYRFFERFSVLSDLISDTLGNIGAVLGGALGFDTVQNWSARGQVANRTLGEGTGERISYQDQTLADDERRRNRAQDREQRRAKALQAAAGGGAAAYTPVALSAGPRTLSAPVAGGGNTSTTTTHSVVINQGPMVLNVPAGAKDSDVVRRVRQAHESERRATAEALRRSGGGR